MLEQAIKECLKKGMFRFLLWQFLWEWSWRKWDSKGIDRRVDEYKDCMCVFQRDCIYGKSIAFQNVLNETVTINLVLIVIMLCISELIFCFPTCRSHNCYLLATNFYKGVNQRRYAKTNGRCQSSNDGGL